MESTSLSRRLFASGVIAALPVSAFAASAHMTREELEALERYSGGRMGVFALDLSNNRTLSYRQNERFKLQSSFKGLLTAMVLHKVAVGSERLDSIVRYGIKDVVVASPVTEARVSSGKMTVGELCAATMATSDNTAANLLMRRLGGPGALTSYLRSIGDKVTQVNNYEGKHASQDPFPSDSTTPAAILKTLREILLGSILPPQGEKQWRSWMESNQHGLSRLRNAFPSDWQSGDRTGTSDGICNDYAYAFRPGRRPLLIAAYFSCPGMDLMAQEAVLRDIGKIIVAWQR